MSERMIRGFYYPCGASHPYDVQAPNIVVIFITYKLNYCKDLIQYDNYINKYISTLGAR
jgi:hypothetical protein